MRLQNFYVDDELMQQAREKLSILAAALGEPDVLTTSAFIRSALVQFVTTPVVEYDKNFYDAILAQVYHTKRKKVSKL